MGLFDKQKLLDLKSSKEEKLHTILIVDDEPSNLRVLSSLLESHYNILLASDGQDALELIERLDDPEEISLILSDQRMPRLTGTEFFEKVIEILPDAIRIIITAYTDLIAIVNAINKANIYKYISKPFERNDLMMAIQRAIEVFELRRELKNYRIALEQRISERTTELEAALRSLSLQNEALEIANQKLEEMSLSDPLTGLRNRRFLLQVIDRDIAELRRERELAAQEKNAYLLERANIAFLIVDIDFFKAVNDKYGHASGDQVLNQISKLLNKACRASDIIVRWGGEEFLLSCKHLPAERACLIAERVRTLIEEHPFTVQGEVILHKTCSVGFASYPLFVNAPEALTWEQTIKLADSALFTAKRSGRNAWVGFEPSSMIPGDAFLQRLISAPGAAVRSQNLKVVTSIPNKEELNWG